MKEIIHLAEQYLSLARLGFCERDLKVINVEYDCLFAGETEYIKMGSVSRIFDKHGNDLKIPDHLLFDERARNEFIEEYTLKLNELRSVIEFNRRKVIEEKIEQLQQHLTVAA